jgi:Tol biopolymer transport system component/phospholipase C
MVVRRSLAAAVTVGLTAAATLAGPGSRSAIPHGTASEPLVRGDGLIAFTSTRTGDREIFVMNPDGGGQTNLSNDGQRDDFGAAWSPDGSRIAFVSDRAGDPDIWTMNADGSGQTNLSNYPGIDTSPTWSPDGSRIAFSSDRTGNLEIWIMDADGSNLSQFTLDPSIDLRPAWSPDGSAILWTSDRTGDREIFKRNADGTGRPVDLTNDPGHSNDDAAWAPDGSEIAFDSDRNGHADLFVMNRDGNAQTDLTAATRGSSFDPTFAPDQASRVAYTLFSGTGDAQIGLSNVTPTKGTYGVPVAVSRDPGSASEPSWQPLVAGPPNGSPIQHVVVLFQENHSFDNVLGLLCAEDDRCDGATVGYLHDGTSHPLVQASDLVPDVRHSPGAQAIAVAGGLMNGFDLIKDCGPSFGYRCYTQFSPEQIPNLATLARAFALSDRTFENDLVASWAAHLQLATAITDGFSGDNPRPGTGNGIGWGCDSLRLTNWHPSLGARDRPAPSCIPFPDGTGPFEPTPVPWVPTIMDRLDGAGLTWKLYAPRIGEGGYTWSVCPTFSECIYGNQGANHVPTDQVLTDASEGSLPVLSLVISGDNSQHNRHSMLQGDDWIGEVVSTLMKGPEWGSTAVFITYDDCGCFYDHVSPPTAMGIRVPMVIVSPYARAGYTDSATASYASMLAFVEHTFGLAPLSSEDADVYDFANSFDYSQKPLPGVHLTTRPVPEWELRWMRQHPVDPDDPS